MSDITLQPAHELADAVEGALDELPVEVRGRRHEQAGLGGRTRASLLERRTPHATVVDAGPVVPEVRARAEDHVEQPLGGTALRLGERVGVRGGGAPQRLMIGLQPGERLLAGPRPQRRLGQERQSGDQRDHEQECQDDHRLAAVQPDEELLQTKEPDGHQQGKRHDAREQLSSRRKIEPFGHEALLDHVADIFARESSDAWFARPVEDFVPAGYVCPKCPGRTFTKEEDILDVWFDSGVSFAASSLPCTICGASASISATSSSSELARM